MIVIDTHALVWTMEADRRLGQGARRLIDAERIEAGAGIAPISIWEAAMLVDKGRLALPCAVADWFNRILSVPGFVLTPLDVATAADAGALPGNIHGDPADRLIIATARSLGCPVLTADNLVLAYAAAGHVRAIDARR